MTDKSSYSQDYVRERIAFFDMMIEGEKTARQTWVDLLEPVVDTREVTDVVKALEERMAALEAAVAVLVVAEQRRNGPMTW